MAKVLPFQIPKPRSGSLIFQVDKADRFYAQLHRHEEIQVSLILEGDGDLIVGDSIHRYSETDVFLIGGNVPHLFKSDVSEGTHSHMLTLFFKMSSFGSSFFELDEFDELSLLFEKITLGMRVTENRNEVKRYFLALETAGPMERFLLLLQILRTAANSESSPLASFVFNRPYGQDEGSRMSDVISYAMSSFEKDITLTEVADIANMSPNAFCRYFKQRTQKTFFQFLMEIRLEQACRLLIKEKGLSIVNVSERCGFKNMSNFNRMFRRHTGETPRGYRKVAGSI